MKTMKKSFLPIISLAMIFAFSGCSNSEASSSQTDSSATGQTYDNETTEAHQGFKVEGTSLLDANGNEFVMRGINHAHTWFKDCDSVAIPAISMTGANTIRLVFADGDQWDKDSLETISSLIESCKERNMIAIVEVHDGTGMDDESYLENAADFWIEMKDALIGNEDYVILNIANEWYGSWDSEAWRDGYVSVIPRIREAGIMNTIMVDAAGWAQYGKSIGDYGKEIFDSDPQGNTMFSVHMYGSAGGSEEAIEQNLKYATEQGLCVCVGEFGYKHSDGEVDEAYIMSYCEANNIGYLGWSWKGNGGGVEYLDLAEDWTGETLSADWGEVLINGENGIKATSKICTVFEN